MLTKVFNNYENKSFNVISLITDIEFECIRDETKPVNLATLATDVHVSDIEVSVKLMKEDIRCTAQGLPYKRYTKLIIK